MGLPRVLTLLIDTYRSYNPIHKWWGAHLVLMKLQHSLFSSPYLGR